MATEDLLAALLGVEQVVMVVAKLFIVVAVAACEAQVM